VVFVDCGRDVLQLCKQAPVLTALWVRFVVKSRMHCSSMGHSCGVGGGSFSGFAQHISTCVVCVVHSCAGLSLLCNAVGGVPSARCTLYEGKTCSV
jgi:hypothetical protein